MLFWLVRHSFVRSKRYDRWTRLPRTPRETQTENGKEIVSRLLENDKISQSGCRKYNGNCILKSCWPCRNIKLLSPSGRPENGARSNDQGHANFHIWKLAYPWSYKLQAITWIWFLIHSLFGFRWTSAIVWFSGHIVLSTNELTNEWRTDQKLKAWGNMDKSGKYWGFMEQDEAVKDTMQYRFW